VFLLGRIAAIGLASDSGLSSVVCHSVCVLVMFVSPAKTAEPIEMPFGWGLTRAGPGNHVVDGAPDLPRGRGNLYGCTPH